MLKSFSLVMLDTLAYTWIDKAVLQSFTTFGGDIISKNQEHLQELVLSPLTTIEATEEVFEFILQQV